MSELSVEVEFFEEAMSLDLFSDRDSTLGMNTLSEESSYEPEPSDDVPEWKGVSIDEIRKGFGVFDFQEQPPVYPSGDHTVLISLPLPAHGLPKPYPDHQVDKWSQNYVRMPHSTHSICPVEEEGENRRYRKRWEIIQESLLQSFSSSQQLEAAILSYNHMYAQRWDFTALHYFFSKETDEDESKLFFDTLLPKIIQLALQLPELITGPIPLLKRHTNQSLTLSQLQVACLLANAFLCTFPRRNSSNPQSEYAAYPYINFNRLFSAFKEDSHNRCASVLEKLKCLFHYFRRVTNKGGVAPEGVITIRRRYIPKEDCPKWENLDTKLLPLHVTSKGTIETEGAGFLQVDFANKYLGGGVLGLGCVQEEIRFVVCPELMVTMLVTEVLDDTEAVIVTGIERYSKYKGYSDNFKWVGDFVDETPRDSSGRRMTSVVAIDALYFKHSTSQFSMSNITRELNKAYVGFVGYDIYKDNLAAIATGNWGCGAFRGNPKLKVLIQLMAAAAAKRSIVYFTFGDTKLRDDVAEMYLHLVQENIDIARLFSLFSQYREASSGSYLDFYQFLYRKSKIKPITRYFNTKNESSQVKVTKKYSDESNITTENICTSKNKEWCFAFDDKENSTEEKKIENWLMNMDADTSSNSEIKDTETKAEINEKKQDDNQSNENKSNGHCDTNVSPEKKKKQSLWKMLGKRSPTKAQTCERQLTGLDALTTKESNDNECVNIKDVKDVEINGTTINSVNLLMTEQQELSAQNKHEVKCSKDVCTKGLTSLKQNTFPKKSTQKKISDFFQ